MDSRTKNRQTRATIDRMITEAFGAAEVPLEADAIVELERGWFNAVYAARLRTGRRVVLKVAPSPRTQVLTYERRALWNELAALRIVAGSCDVPVPDVEFADVSGRIVDSPWFFMTYVEGRNLGELLEEKQVSIGESNEWMVRVGSTNRLLNAIEGPAFGYVDGPAWRTWREAFHSMVLDLLGDARHLDVDLGVAESRVHAVLTSHLASMDAVTTPRLVSWDLWPGNILVEKGRIAGVVDHERALWGDPLMEAGFMGPEVPIYPGRASFAHGYGSVEFGPNADRRRLLYSLHLLLIMIIEPAVRGLQDFGQGPWSRERLRLIIAQLEG